MKTRIGAWLLGGSVALLVVWACAGSSPPRLSSPSPAAERLGEFSWELPAGFPVPVVPADNPMSEEKVRLGRHLFHDTRLSGNQTYSCASCHRQKLAFTDGRGRALGSTGEIHPRSAMSLANTAYSRTLNWADPGLDRLEAQLEVPMFNRDPVELGLTGREAEVEQRLRRVGLYRDLFAEAFPGQPDPVSMGNVVRALASFERTLVSGDSAYDRLVFGGDREALSAEAWSGMRLFFSGRLACFECHSGFTFSGPVVHRKARRVEPEFHNTGLYGMPPGWSYPPRNRGVFELSREPGDMGRFKAPTLRNIELTAPYMHDGSLDSLEEVLDHYASGGRLIASGPYAGDGRTSPHKSELMRGFEITREEKRQLIAFLESLTDERFVTEERFSDPWSRDPPRASALRPTPGANIPSPRESAHEDRPSREIRILRRGSDRRQEGQEVRRRRWRRWADPGAGGP